MKKHFINIQSLLFSIFLAISISPLAAQSGDQILDGIGETGMVARYLFDGDVKDWSRNNLHGKFHGNEPVFINDNRFGKVISLNGNKDAYITIPSDGLADIESISISGWVNLRSAESGQFFFDFGNGDDKHFVTTLTGTKSQKGLCTTISTTDANKKELVSHEIDINKWVHIAIVVDVPGKSLVTYVNGKPVGQINDTGFNLSKIFQKQPDAKKQLYIGKSNLSEGRTLNALIHDFRIYRIPLSTKQVGRIYSKTTQNLNEGIVNEDKKEDDLQKFPESQQQLFNSYLIGVSDVNVETEIGELPRLPSYVDGIYKDGIKGPKVRVLWPAETDNNAVLKSGNYTLTGRVSGTNFQPKAIVQVNNQAKSATPTLQLETFNLGQVSLNSDTHGHDTKFIENRDKFITTLAETNPDSFLYMFRNTYGQKQPEGATPLGVWDSQETKLRGHATGHYLTAIAQAYEGTGYDKKLQENFLGKMEYMVNTLYELSRLSGNEKAPGIPFVLDPRAVPAGPGKNSYDSDLSESGIRTDYWNWGKGYISAYPPDQFIMLEQGATYGGQNSQVWAPYYTLHKILAGLIDIYTVSGNKKALDVATGMGDWVHARLSQLPTEQLVKMWNSYIAGEFGGMNESMARLYRITDKTEYLETAQLFDNIRMFFGDTSKTHGLAKNVDVFRGLHANQHIPQVVGSIETYRASLKPEYYKIADNFWHKTVNDYMYSIGGVAGARNPANAECFIAQPATLYENGFSSGGQNETCATYNMLKLTNDLFLFDQRGEFMDYYERGLYNHILASVAQDNPGNTYHVPLRPGSIKHFGNSKMTGFTCCNGTAIESSTKLQSAIYYKSKDNKSLYVNLYIPSTLNWEERNVIVEQSTSFPKEDETRLTINGSGKFDIKVRVPGWATNGFSVKINGKDQKLDANPGTYLTINRKWKKGDVIDLKMPFHFYLDPIMDQQNIASLFYGPVLLAAQEPEARKDWRKITLDVNDIGNTINKTDKPLEFIIDGVVFKPFYDSYERHSVYLDFNLK
ncbi:glycoside hydrolase family 127 protein [Belliella sp. R4-6]|uniref:Glycoside hydrolase family 127 protein n=1 Tax=Belliella alkalica TaxID=1730871 RepID=A0ABS9VG92_9BACT|nr:beta-L-arabinofuranosidase domain-containing protein [Belliella alkalica]MCH7415438.1 glycoside hydrolase family 127 protein [Belliella alkalica]